MTQQMMAPPTSEVELKTEVASFATKAKALALNIKDDESFNLATAMYNDCAVRRKRAIAFFAESKDLAHKAWKAICGNEKTMTDPIDEAEKALKQPINAYYQEQQRLAAVESARLQKEAQAQLDNSVLAEATALEEVGDKAGAEQVLAAAPVATTQRVVVPKAAGIKTFRDNWKGEFEDIRALCRAVAEGKAPSNYLLFNESVINGVIRAQKSQANIPGVKVVCEKIPVR